jgi:S-layer protein
MTIQQHASFDSSAAELNATSKLVRAWESKNAKNAAKAGGISMMALSLAACGGSSDTSSGNTNTTSSSDLTVNADTTSFSGTLSAARDYTPGGNDLVNTLQSDDTISGTGSADVVNVTFGNNNDAGAATVAPTMTGVETINFNNVSSNGAVDTLDMSNVTGTTAVNVTSLSDDTVIRGLDDIDVLLKAANVSDEDADVAFEFDDTVVAGASDAVSLTVDNFAGADVNLGSAATNAAAGAGIETLNITASGSASTIANLGSTGVTSITIDADADLTISAMSATGVTSINASESSAGVTIAAGANAGNELTYTGGDGADNLQLTAEFDGLDSLSGGAGTADELRITLAANDTSVGALDASSAAVVTGFESIDLRVTAGGAATTIGTDMDFFSGATSVDIGAADISATTTFTLTDLSATQAGDIDVSIGANANAGVVVVADMKVNGTDTVDLDVTTTADGQDVTLNDANNNIENANIALSGTFNTVLDVDATSFLTSLTVSGGAGAHTLTTGTAFANTTVDMSAVASNITFTSGGTTQTITTGSGNDALTLNVGKKTVDMGAGNDTVNTSIAMLGTAAASWDTIDGGDGTDTLALTTMGAITAEAAVGISGFERISVSDAAGANATINMGTDIGTISRITVGDTNDAVATFSNLAADFTDLRFSAAAEADTEAALTRVVDSSTNSMTVTITGSETVKALTLNDEETITISSTDTNAATITTLTSSDVTTLTLSGAGNVIITNAISGSTAIATVDASDLAAAATVNATNSVVAMTFTGNDLAGGVLTFTGGSGADTINGGLAGDTLTGGNGIDTISGGAGADTLVGGVGSDILTGGAGADIFTFTVTEAGVDVIKDGSFGTGGDTIAVANILAGAAADATAVEEASAGGVLLDDGDVFVLTTTEFVDTSGANAADLTAIKAAAGGLTADASSEQLAIFKADTNGDGAADSVQVWYLTAGAGNTVIDTAAQLMTLDGYSVSADLASDFVVTNFDL